jgi:hypothetical protein
VALRASSWCNRDANTLHDIARARDRRQRAHTWASRNEYIQKTEREGDWLGCAKALIEHGMTPDWEGEYADDVADYFATLRTEQSRG